MLTPLTKNGHLETEGCFGTASNDPCVRPVILTLGLMAPFEQAFHGPFRVVEAVDSEDAMRLLAQAEVAVLVLGSRITPDEALSIFSRHRSSSPGASTVAVLFCAGNKTEVLQMFVNEADVFYMARNEISAGQLHSIIMSAASRFQSRRKERHDSWAEAAARIDVLLDFCIRLAMQADLASAAALLIETARELIMAESVQYLAYDAKDDTLTPAGAEADKDWGLSAAAGLAAFAARTGERIRLDCAGLDPRYDAETDNPGGTDDAYFLAEPVIGSKGALVGVITATRPGRSKPFSAADAYNLELLGECAAPILSQMLIQNRIQELLIQRTVVPDSNPDVFRREALEYHIRSWNQQGEALKTVPPWLRRTYWVMLGLVLAGLVAFVAAALCLHEIFGKAG